MDKPYKSSEDFLDREPDIDVSNRELGEKTKIEKYIEERIAFFGSIDSIEHEEDIAINKKVIKILREIKKEIKV